VFQQINRERTKLGSNYLLIPECGSWHTAATTPNCSSAAAGFFAYTLHIPGRDDASIARTQWEALELLQKMGFRESQPQTV